MADNVQLPVTGTGTADVVAATDDVASVHYPFVKLVDGTLGGTGKIGGDATFGLDVDVTRIAGTVVEDQAAAAADPLFPIGQVRRDTPVANAADGDYIPPITNKDGKLWVASRGLVRVSQTPTITAGAYAAGDVVGAALTFAGAAHANGGAGRVLNAVITSRAIASAYLELWLFEVSPTLANADNGVFDLTDANLEAAKLISIVEFVVWQNTAAGQAALGTVQGQRIGGATVPYVCDSGGTAIYGALCTRNAPTYASTSDLVVSLHLAPE